SKATALGNKVADGAYDTMISRITSNTNPDFFMLNYLSDENRVTDLIVIPKYFMTPNIIERRNPLSTTARRAGWTGCNILIGDVPKQGKIDIIKDGIELPRNQVIDKIGFSAKFKKKSIDARGWLLDVLDCVNLTDSEFFSLKDMYAYADILKKKHKGNNNIQEKIRQQLQILRDRGVVEFIQRGKYRKIMP
ncbi:MAG: DpnI domain-containing protein, partial [Christensenella sp.]